jgi:hypothetical protein
VDDSSLNTADNDQHGTNTWYVYNGLDIRSLYRLPRVIRHWPYMICTRSRFSFTIGGGGSALAWREQHMSITAQARVVLQPEILQRFLCAELPVISIVFGGKIWQTLGRG